MSASEDLDAMVEDLGHQEVSVRLAAKRKLVTVGAAAVEPIIGVLRAGSLRQVATAISTLGAIADPRSIDPLVQMLHAPHSLFRVNAAQALAHFDDPGVIEALLGALHDEDELVQTWTVNSLVTLGSKQSIEPLLALLHRAPSPMIRHVVIEALGKLGDPQVINHIVPYLNDEDRHVKEYAQSALAKLGYRDNSAQGEQ